jgi:dGTPase
MIAHSPFASMPDRSRGRRHPEPVVALRGGTRDAFQRDRDRIIHSSGFRRLRHKTQVFMAPDGDHFRVRLTHSLEVAQIGRTIARALGLNEDLTEALCLAHDIGHPPFGHAGEDALDEALRDAGGFDHNGHTLATVTRLDSPYPSSQGLNLSWEALEGLAKHNGPVAEQGWALAAVDREWPLDLDRWPSLEAQVAAIADDIAYDNHDIDDGLRAGLLDFDEIVAVPFVARVWSDVQKRWSGTSKERLHGELIRTMIGVMVNDVIARTHKRIRTLGINTVEDARRAGEPVACFSDQLQGEERELKRLMYAKLYHHPSQLAAAEMARGVIARLFAAYTDDPRRLPPAWLDTMPADDPARGRHVAEFIAGMTDRFAIARHEEHIGPVNLPAGF